MQKTLTTEQTEYIEGTQQQLDLWGQRFSSLERAIERSTADGIETLERKLEALKRRRRALRTRLHEAAHTAREEWEDVRSDLEIAMDDFRELALESYDTIRRA